MLLIKQDDDPLIAGSFGRRHERTMVPRGIADARAGLAPSSEHPDYGVAYQSAARLHSVEQGLLVMFIGEGVTCCKCGACDAGLALFACACEVRDVANDIPGMFVMHGEGSTEEAAPFRSHAFLRDLTASGVRIETLGGEDVTHKVHYLQ